MTKLTEFDIDELVFQIHEDLKLAFHLAQVDQLSGSFQIDSVRARLGRKDLDKLASPGNRNLLNPERYPDEEDWEIELNYSKRNNTCIDKKSFASPSDPLLFENLKGLPLSSLKGISEHWQRVFTDVNVLTLGDLADLPETQIHDMCKKLHTFLPQEFQTKVVLLKQPLLMVEKIEGEHLLFKDIAMCSENELKTIFSNHFTNNEIRRIKNTIDLLMLVLDKDVFINLSLNNLFRSEMRE